MKNTLFFLLILLSLGSCNQKKKIWAKSFIHQKAPELIVEEWLSEKPDLQGKFVLVDFWATWCAPCKKGIPELNSFQNEFKDDLVVIGITDESKEKVGRYVGPAIEYYSAIDTKKRVMGLLEVRGIPHCILIDPKGIVRWEGLPQLEGFELTSEVIQDLIKKYK
ncbi:TlpA family protein disulfide reductase [Saccharicrinis fermentans]|uniref:Thiol-disulfide oxidoreductase ResA n=1 Tax=Saccharicrinis fermentans DSM 9555 = JCM 21142 TaxID=869213 RepID=W7YCL6_9BACT|nr:TlpA disulfide reductase family protein [Saccharicrinis fermentans]GAF05213.1 thiol-disulfide oxidoreductase ResA [Saccharicrinis fermentans DSM 9555 = JCM 21142]